MMAFLWKMHDIFYFTRMPSFIAQKYLAVQIIIFPPHIQCVCFVAFSDQAKKKTKTKNKKTAAYELICSYKKALYF